MLETNHEDKTLSAELELGAPALIKSVAEIAADIDSAIKHRKQLINQLTGEIAQLEARRPLPYTPSNGLSERERTVMQLVSTGASNKEIANALGISETTVKAHMRSILEKLHVKNRAEASALFAKMTGLTPA